MTGCAVNVKGKTPTAELSQGAATQCNANGNVFRCICAGVVGKQGLCQCHAYFL